MDILAVDQHAVYHRRGNNSFLHTPQPTGQSMTFQQQQQLLKLLNAHASGGAGAGTGLSFYGAHGNSNNMKQVPKHQQQHIPPHSYAPSPAPVHLPPTNVLLPPRPAYSSLPAPHLVRQQSNPPLLPLPFNRSSSLPVPGPARPPARNKPVQSAAPAPRVNGSAKDQQKIRPGKAALTTAMPPVVAKPKRTEPSTTAPPARVDVFKQAPILPAVDTKRPDAAAPPEAKEYWKLGDVYKTEVQLQGASVTDRSTGFSVYSLAPHPSSLPLPRLISLKPKGAVPVPASCNAEAVMIGGADSFDQGPGTTADDLRRLLRL